MKTQIALRATLLYIPLTLWACEDDDPRATPLAGSIAGDIAGDTAGDTSGDTSGDTAGDTAGDTTIAECIPPDTDYPSASWEMCISDDGSYELIGESTPSSAARVVAYELIGERLWENDTLTPEDFIQAELIYAEDGGVGSRVTRRYDAHLERPEGADCAAEDSGIRWPEYCVGPARIEPLILNAFASGIAGTDPQRSVAEIRAGLLWFYYISVYKEAYTCAGKAADCDSHWAYHNGGTQRDEEALGLGGEIDVASEEAYDAIFDAHLAVRCWRDLDDAAVAEDDILHEQVLAQLDTALDYGYARMIAARLRALANEPSALQSRVMLSILGPTLSRALLERQPSLAGDWSALWTQLADEELELDASTLNMGADQIEDVFACP